MAQAHRRSGPSGFFWVQGVLLHCPVVVAITKFVLRTRLTVRLTTTELLVHTYSLHRVI